AHAQRPAHPFDAVGSVLQHPRCMNCHTTTDFPRQTDAGLRHAQYVMRGDDGTGVAAMHCQTCHQSSNQERVPGAAGWHLPALSMGWEGLSRSQLCAAIQDPAKNGGRRGAQVIEHMKTDPLVLWAWQPGADRTSPALSHAEFVA